LKIEFIDLFAHLTEFEVFCIHGLNKLLTILLMKTLSPLVYSGSPKISMTS